MFYVIIYIMKLCKDCNINPRYISPKGYKNSYCSKCINIRSADAQKKYFSSSVGKEKIRINTRNYQRKQNGFSPELFEETLVNQNYMCAICLKDIHESSHADHDHNTGSPRGILCPGCNTLLGRLESVGFDWVDSAKSYLSRY